MLTFILCIAALVVGYIFYGKRVDKIFGSDDRETPAIALNDGVDFVPMKGWKIFLVQLLNIAGLGPIFGALNGALFGPVVYLWIVFGTIFAGGVHDYMCGMLSMRHKGASISEITGTYLGKVMLQVMRVFSVILLVMVGVVFSKGPAGSADPREAGRYLLAVGHHHLLLHRHLRSHRQGHRQDLPHLRYLPDHHGRRCCGCSAVLSRVSDARAVEQLL